MRHGLRFRLLPDGGLGRGGVRVRRRHGRGRRPRYKYSSTPSTASPWKATSSPTPGAANKQERHRPAPAQLQRQEPAAAATRTAGTTWREQAARARATRSSASTSAASATATVGPDFWDLRQGPAKPASSKGGNRTPPPDTIDSQGFEHPRTTPTWSTTSVAAKAFLDRRNDAGEVEHLQPVRHRGRRGRHGRRHVDGVAVAPEKAAQPLGIGPSTRRPASQPAGTGGQGPGRRRLAEHQPETGRPQRCLPHCPQLGRRGRRGQQRADGVPVRRQGRGRQGFAGQGCLAGHHYGLPASERRQHTRPGITEENGGKEAVLDWKLPDTQARRREDTKLSGSKLLATTTPRRPSSRACSTDDKGGPERSSSRKKCGKTDMPPSTGRSRTRPPIRPRSRWTDEHADLMPVAKFMH